MKEAREKWGLLSADLARRILAGVRDLFHLPKDDAERFRRRAEIQESPGCIPLRDLGAGMQKGRSNEVEAIGNGI